VRTSGDPDGIPEGAGPRYGWLGAERRAVDGGSALMLMGARVYAPRIGRFLQVDPVNGGNETTYGYPNDPVNFMDPMGLYSVSGHGFVAWYSNRTAVLDFYITFGGARAGAWNAYLHLEDRWDRRYWGYSSGTALLRSTVHIRVVARGKELLRRTDSWIWLDWRIEVTLGTGFLWSKRTIHSVWYNNVLYRAWDQSIDFYVPIRNY
jgi:RHS repeat-associated protein